MAVKNNLSSWIIRIVAFVMLLWSSLAFFLTHPNIAKRLSIDVLNPWSTESRLTFLHHSDGQYEQALSLNQALERYRANGGSDGPHTVFDVKLFAKADVRGLWAPTSFRHVGWVKVTSPTPDAMDDQTGHALILVPLARDIWNQSSRMRPLMKSLYANAGSSASAAISGPWRTNWWGYAINALTVLALGMLTSPLWWKRLQKWRAHQHESPAIPAH